MLDVRLALDGVGDALVEFHVDEPLQAVSLGESRYEPFSITTAYRIELVLRAIRFVLAGLDPAIHAARVSPHSIIDSTSHTNPAITDSLQGSVSPSRREANA